MRHLKTICATFIYKIDKKPVSGKEHVVKIYDNDIVSDDFLGEGVPDRTGKIEIKVDLSKSSSPDSPIEKNPDIYFELFNEHGVIYQSPVFRNVNFTSKEESISVDNSEQMDFGTFEIE